MKCKILIVDDHPDTAWITKLLLTLRGHECMAVETGVDAIAAVHNFKPVIAVLDVGLPDISGYDLARCFRRTHNALLHLIAFTGWGQAKDRARALEAGFNQHVPKPANAAKIHSMISTAIEHISEGMAIQ